MGFPLLAYRRFRTFYDFQQMRSCRTRRDRATARPDALYSTSHRFCRLASPVSSLLLAPERDRGRRAQQDR